SDGRKENPVRKSGFSLLTLPVRVARKINFGFWAPVFEGFLFPRIIIFWAGQKSLHFVFWTAKILRSFLERE
ncbi:MAG: hypothetical protein ACYCPS_04875, partial [Candidatus Saccharimonadales bacterium]